MYGLAMKEENNEQLQKRRSSYLYKMILALGQSSMFVKRSEGKTKPSMSNIN